MTAQSTETRPQGRAARLRVFLDRNKVFFETVAAFFISAASLAVIVVQTFLAAEQGALSKNQNEISKKQNELLEKQNELVDLQTRVVEAQAMPLFDIKISQLLNPESQKADNYVLTIDNSGGPVHEFYVTIRFVIQIQAALNKAPMKQAKLSFQVFDYYAAKAVSALSKGRLVTTVAYNNNGRLFTLSKALREASLQHGWSYANLDEETFVHLTYKDILTRFHSEYYSVAPVSGSTALSETEGKAKFEEADKLPRKYLSELAIEKIGPLIDEALTKPAQ